MDIANFDLNLLKVFDALMEERNVTRAGTRVGLSQPAVSGALSRLRGHFDDELFVRTSEGMCPTPRAEELAGSVREALSLVGDALGGPKPFDPSVANGQVTLGLTDYAAAVVLPSLVTLLEREAPGIDLTIRAMEDRDDVAARLDDGSIDLTVSGPSNVPSRIRTDLLFEESFVCLLVSNEPDSHLSLEAYCAADHVLVSLSGDRSGVVDRELQKIGLNRRVRVALPQFAVAPFVVAHSGLIATLPRRIAKPMAALHPRLTTKPVPVKLPSFDLSLHWHQRTDAILSHRWLRDAVRRAVEAGGLSNR